MRISILCSNISHPVYSQIIRWKNVSEHEVSVVSLASQLDEGDLLFLVSCSEIIASSVASKFKAVLVLHASDLPRGRGWSPHIWEILNGGDSITLSLIEAIQPVDSGRIYAQRVIPMAKDALWDEINCALFESELALIDDVVSNWGGLIPYEQSTEVNVTYCRRRGPGDSRVDPNKSIAQQFNLLRVCDPNRFPAFFELFGKKYKILLEKVND